MEHAASCQDQSIKTGLFNCLTETYRCFLAGACPEQSAADMASTIYSGFRGLVPGKEGSPPEDRNENIAERTCIFLSFVERISSSLTSQALPPDVTFYYVEVLKVLFEDMDLMPHLIYLFQAEDQIITHLAAKTASKCVFYLIQKSGTISPVWQRKCEQSFQSSAPGLELDACLWSLTDVSKRLLKGAHRDFVMTLLAGFDSSLSALCSKLIPEEKKDISQYVVDFTRRAHWGTTFCLMLDLLEVLTTSSLVCGAGSSLTSQRITYRHSSALLSISCSSEYYVKKRVLLFLKKAVLQKAGEDWTPGPVASTQTKCGTWSSDMSVLTRTVLTAAAGNWLQSVQVESAAFFGGTRHSLGDESLNSDCVVLRAVSLILLKSIEVHLQTAAGSGMDTAENIHAYLQRLWGFLRRCSVKLRELTHSCCWISVLFGEQDDDMMEAARTLLFIFLHYRLTSGLDTFAALEAACASGFNPHCHFVLLLQSISFDHSILLDFLISAETCFLEYFVQYLKYLRDDWEGFRAACGGIPVPASCGDERLTLKNKDEPDQEGSGSCVSPPGEHVSLPAELRLVDYDSSDESEPEDTQVSESTAALLSEPNSTLETRPERLLQPVSHSEQTPSTNMTALSWQGAADASARAVLCLSELRQVVMRLHTKKLFPYNPSSLVKLLAQVESLQKSQ